jgi:ribosome-associated protein
MVDAVAEPPRLRRATKPTWGSQQRRLQGKAVRGAVKAGRGKVQDGSA